MRHDLKFWLVLVALVAGSAGPLRAEKPAPRFLVRTDVDLVAGLPTPPAPGSLAATADMEAVLQAQVWRTPATVAWAKAVDAGTVWDYAEVVGPWFSAAQLPHTARLFKEIGKELQPVSVAAKKPHNRPRPFRVDARIQPCIPLPDGASYPSGHALYIFMEAEVLSELFPELRKELFEHAQKMAWGRVLAGVHFPTDTVGGRLLAKAFVDEIKKTPAFQKELEACRAEAAPHQALKRTA